MERKGLAIPASNYYLSGPFNCACGLRHHKCWRWCHSDPTGMKTSVDEEMVYRKRGVNSYLCSHLLFLLIVAERVLVLSSLNCSCWQHVTWAMDSVIAIELE